MALTHSPEGRTEASGTGLLDHPGVTADPARHRVPRQARAGAPVLGVTAMAAALGATTGLTATAAAAATPTAAPTPAITAPDGTAATEQDGTADPGLALAARIQQQADTRRTAAEEAARLEAAHEAAAKRAAQQALAAAADAAAQAPTAAAQAPVVEAPAETPADETPVGETPAAQAVTVRPPLAGYTLGTGHGGSPWAQLNTGLDFAAPAGTPVTAITAGTVSAAGWSGAHGYRVIQTLPDGTELWYCHLASITVPAGPVAPGTVLGRIGVTGNSPSLRTGGAPAGPQLHLEVRPAGAAPVDPAGWLRAHGVQL
ncbi:M23 family metallopeptidase [Kitasatospora sp. GAS204B]|uniref:M23 family metallopeptidase n=1 Tax=unclassified Kitasatospora TaxID=2633591 RepID=UPI00247600DB|nr:M23 family metallopeptidase [Kitasatospora sp. GAS204B]MDH6122058.1 murein DD-endopeptidase MepM/ murein hydrolase activator NlpD [Kitasatospora sp. GAS204B]